MFIYVSLQRHKKNHFSNQLPIYIEASQKAASTYGLVWKHTYSFWKIIVISYYCLQTSNQFIFLYNSVQWKYINLEPSISIVKRITKYTYLVKDD